MNQEGDFTKDLYRELALGFRRDYQDSLSYIKTFEGIVKDKGLSKETKAQAKIVLKTLYQQRNDYGNKAEWYRKILNAAPGCQRVITWPAKRA